MDELTLGVWRLSMPRARRIISWVALIAIAGGSVVWLIGPAASTTGASNTAANRKCPVGKPATLRIKRVPGKILSKPLVFGCAHAVGLGEVQFVGFRTPKESCVSIDHPQVKSTEPILCALAGRAPVYLCHPSTICAHPPVWSKIKGRTYSTLNGEVSNQVSNVLLRHTTSSDGSHLAKGAVRHLRGKLQKKLGFAAPVGIYAVTVGGCLSEERLSLVAKDDEGKRIGKAEPIILGPRECST